MGFEIGFVWPDLFGYVHEIQSDYNAERDGSIHQHKPSLFFKHIDDISIKYALIRLSLNKIITILNNISSKYDKENKKLELGEEYWELILYLNCLIIEARSILDIFQKIHVLLYHQCNFPDSYRKMIDSQKHLSNFPNDIYREYLKSLKKERWINNLVTINQKTSLRDKLSHYAQLVVTINPNSKKELEYFIDLTKKTQHFLSDKKTYPLDETLNSIVLGIDQHIKVFKKAHTKDILMELLF